MKSLLELKKIITFTLIFGSFLIAHAQPKTALRDAKSSIFEVQDRKTIVALVKEIKRTEEGMELLKPEFYAKAYSTNFRCGRRQIFLLSDFDMEIPDSVAKIEKRGFPNVGSGGHQLRIFLQQKNGKFRIVWNEVVIGLVRFQRRRDCPDLLVVLHGGEFDRVGDEYGIGRLRYGDGQFSLLKRNGRAVEE